MSQLRRQSRVAVDIAVTLTTVLESLEGRLTNLSDHGAQLAGAALAPGTRFQIEYQGQTVFAQSRWAEVDRMGIFFPFGLGDGPLRDALAMARDTSADQAENAPPPVSLFARRHGVTGFGRRSH